MARRILALDLGSHSLKAAVIESSLSRCRVIDLFQQPREPERSLTEQLQEFFTVYQLQADTILSCLPGEAVSHRMLTLPFSQARQISQASPFELESLIPFSLDDVVITDQTIQHTEEGTQALAVATLKKTVAEHLDVLTAVGFDPTQVVLAPLAPLALLSFAQVNMSGVSALIDVGEKHTSVVLLREGMLAGFRTLTIGRSHAGGLTAFLQELRWTLLALNGDDPLLLNTMFLCGGGAYFSQLRKDLEREFAVEVVPLQQLTIPAVSEIQRENQATFATCLGMGLHEALRGTTPMVNLRQGEFVPQRHDETVRSEFRRLGWLTGGVAAAAGLAFLLNLHQLNTRYQSLRQEVRRTFVAALPNTQTVVNEKIQLEDAVEALQKRQRILRGTATGSPLDILRHLSAVIPEQVVLDLDEWTFDEDAVRLQGTTTSFEATEALKTAIMSLGLFREAQLKDVKTVAGSKKVSFRLQLLFQKSEDQEAQRPEKDRAQQAEVRQPNLATSGREG